MLTLMTAQPAEAELPRLAALQRIEEDRQGHRWLKESPDVGLLWQNYAYILDRPNNGQTDHAHGLGGARVLSLGNVGLIINHIQCQDRLPIGVVTREAAWKMELPVMIALVPFHPSKTRV